MPNKAFLKKKSFLDDFRDNQEGTGYIQSARAERTWNNPITRGKRTKKLNTWIKSFDGKRHIHKLARFNRMQTGRDESYEDVKLDCLRYGGVLELPNGVCVKVNAKIRCPRMAAFVFRITGIYDAEPENPSKYVIRGFYPVYGPERKPSKEFDIPCNDVSDIEQWIKSNEKGNRMQHENLEEAMSLTKFTDVVTDKLIKQYDVDEDDVLGYVESHSQELQELLDDKELSLKEKVLFLREEITGVKNEKKSEAVESTDEKLSYEKGHKNSKGEDAPWVIRSHEDNRVLASFANKKDAEEHLQRMKQYSKSESKKLTNEMVGNKKWVIRIKRLGKNYYVRSSSFTVNKAFRYPSLGGPFVCSDWDITERDIAKYDSYDDAKKSWDSMARVLRGGLPFYKEGEDYEIVQVNFSMMGESKQSERQGYAPYYFCRSKYTGGELAVLADGDSIHYLPSYNIKGFKDKIDYGTIATSFEPIENPETSELHKIVQRKDGRNIIALTQAEFDDFAENNGWGGRHKWFKDILRNRHIIESNDTRERDVDDYDTMRDGLEAMGFELDSDVRNGKIYSYRRVSKATKDGITYTFMIESDKGYTTSIVVYGGKFDNNERGTRFSNVKEVLDAMKTIEESNKSESLINKNEMEAVAEAEESRILDAVQKAAKEAGVDDRLKVSSDKVLVKATLPIDNHDIGEITWVIDGVNGKLTEYVDGEKGYSKKFEDEGPLKDELRICFAAVKDVAGIPESKKTEAVHFEYTDTIRVPQWLWVAYQTGEAHDLNEDELEILDKFKEEYGSKYHMDDKSEDPYFSSRNDFDNLGGNVYDVDLYVEKPVGNKSTEALSTNLEHPFSFKFKFDSPRVTYAMRDEADSGKYDAKLAVIDNDATDVEIFTDSPKAVLKLLDGVAERYNDTYKGMLTRDDLENHFTEAIALVKDVDDDLAAKYFVAFNGKEPDGLVVSGELDNVVSFLEDVK